MEDCQVCGSGEDTLAGAFMPRQLIDMLDLHALSQDTNRSDLIRTILQRWVDVKDDCFEESANKLIRQIALGQFTLLQQYLDLTAMNEWGAITEHFCSILTSKLLKRRIEPDLIEKITQEVMNLATDYTIRSS